jgi:hypothetical protein
MSRVSVVLSAQGLFHNAIVLSASPRTTTLAAVAAQRSALAEHFGWGGGAESVTVESLNKCSSAQLLEAQIQLNLRGTLVVDGDADQDQKGGGGGGGGEGAGGGGTAIALPLVIRLIVGNWDCFSRGALNAETGQCPNGECGGDDQHLCAAA